MHPMYKTPLPVYLLNSKFSHPEPKLGDVHLKLATLGNDYSPFLVVGQVMCDCFSLLPVKKGNQDPRAARRLFFLDPGKTLK